MQTALRHTQYRSPRAVAASAALLLALAIAHSASTPPKPPYTTWSDYGGSADSMQYSALKQINRTNVKRIELAWSYLAAGPSGRFGFNPVIVDGVMYVLGRDNAFVALDAASGKQIWSHAVEGNPTDRGINYWESQDRADRRLIFSANSYLQEINLRTGVTIPSFGKDGRVDLREGLGRDPKTIRNIQTGTPGRVFENLIVLGSAPGEGYGSHPGDLRAYDVLSGKLVWTFHTTPHPGEYGYDTWPKDAWTYIGGNNAWGEISIDEKRGIAYFPLGSPTYDFYGADRIGANLFGNCLLALDARTGKRLWHFQAVHHDLWDYDLATAPKLLTVRHNGKPVDIVAQATKGREIARMRAIEQSYSAESTCDLSVPARVRSVVHDRDWFLLVLSGVPYKKSLHCRADQCQELPLSRRQLTSSLVGIFASNVTKVNPAAWAKAQRYASVQRLGELNGPSVNACHVSGSSFGSTE
jgi:quinoprotein glucose dehydrogenase